LDVAADAAHDAAGIRLLRARDGDVQRGSGNGAAADGADVGNGRHQKPPPPPCQLKLPLPETAASSACPMEAEGAPAPKRWKSDAPRASVRSRLETPLAPVRPASRIALRSVVLLSKSRMLACASNARARSSPPYSATERR